MGKKLDMVAQTTKDLQKMCKELGLTMHLVVSDNKDMIATGCGGSNNIIHLLGDGIADLSEQMGVDSTVVLAHLIVYLKGEEVVDGK